MTDNRFPVPEEERCIALVTPLNAPTRQCKLHGQPTADGIRYCAWHKPKQEHTEMAQDKNDTKTPSTNWQLYAIALQAVTQPIFNLLSTLPKAQRSTIITLLQTAFGPKTIEKALAVDALRTVLAIDYDGMIDGFHTVARKKYPLPTTTIERLRREREATV